MWNYFFKRLLWFFPTLIAISLLAFLISVYAPINPLINQCDDSVSGASYKDIQDCFEKKRKELNLHLPVFYIQFSNLAEPDTLYKITKKPTREALKRFLDQSGNWEAVENYYVSLQNFYNSIKELKKDSAFLAKADDQSVKNIQTSLFQKAKSLLANGNHEQIQAYNGDIEELIARNSFLESVQPVFLETQKYYGVMDSQKTPWKVMVPRVIFHGTQCQYHQWISKILLHGDFGKSYFASWRVGDRIGNLFIYSFSFALISILFAYIIGIGLGIIAAFYHDKWPDRLSGVSVFALDAMPSFWVATMLLIFFANPEFKSFEFFPSSFNQTDGWNLFQRSFLPFIAYTYGAFAAISRIMRASLLEVMNQEFITTARAKGLNEKLVILKHALKNALLPMITGFAGIFPALLGGSVVIEWIYGIPGMGNATYQAVNADNIPMILAVFTLTGLLTMIGYFVADLLYAWADPRIRFGKEKS